MTDVPTVTVTVTADGELTLRGDFAAFAEGTFAAAVNFWKATLPTTGSQIGTSTPQKRVICGARSRIDVAMRCKREPGHQGDHSEVDCRCKPGWLWGINSAGGWDDEQGLTYCIECGHAAPGHHFMCSAVC